MKNPTPIIFSFSNNRLLGLIKWSVGLALLGIVLTFFAYLASGFIGFSSIDPQRISSFGDFVGGFIGTIFLFATTLLVWLTYHSQKTELAETSEVLRKQRFEGTFFNLLKVHQDIKNNLKSNTLQLITWYKNDQQHFTKEAVTGEEFLKMAAEDFGRLYINREGLYYQILWRILTKPNTLQSFLWVKRKQLLWMILSPASK